MTEIILAIHTIIVLALVGVVLMQRSEGGALGMGGGGGGFMSGRGAANVLTRTTTILAALFFTSSFALALTADRGEGQADALREVTGEEAGSPMPGEIGTEDVLDILGEPGEPQVDLLPDPSDQPTAPPLAETPEGGEAEMEPDTGEAETPDEE